jgi:hypothetical protein
MRLQDGDKQKTELLIEHILVCGSLAAMFVGETRKGYAPADSVL